MRAAEQAGCGVMRPRHIEGGFAPCCQALVLATKGACVQS
jgi:hypothetical protein